MADFGGLIQFSYDGKPLIIRAKWDMEPGDFSFTGEHNQDGSYARFVQPMGPMFDLEFEDSLDNSSATSLPWNQIMAGGPYNIVVKEASNGISHTIAAGSFMGRPKVDRLKGIVTGVQIQGAVGSYKQLSI